MIKSLTHLWPYIWPSDRVDLKMRVVYSFAILLAAKIITLIVPFTYKWAVDALTGHGSAPVAADNWLAWAIASPILLTVSYGVARVLMGVLQQWRDGVFAKVAMHAVRRLALQTDIGPEYLRERDRKAERRERLLVKCAEVDPDADRNAALTENFAVLVLGDVAGKRVALKLADLAPIDLAYASG